MFRRTFLKNMAVSSVFLGFYEIVLSACGGGGGGNNNNQVTSHGGNCLANGTSVVIEANHGHTTPIVSAGDISTANQTDYTLGLGTAGHSHTITATHNDFVTLQSNQGVSITTNPDNTGHSHVVVINCV